MTETRILNALREVIDPEIGVNLVDLGLVYEVGSEGRTVQVAMTMTSPACPLRDYLSDSVEAAVRRNLPETDKVEIAFVWEPPWHPGRMSDAAKRELGWSVPAAAPPVR